MKVLKIVSLFMFFTGLSGFDFVGAKSDGQSPMLMVGVAKVDVTPDRPVLLAGYGGRTKEFEGIDTRLWARGLVIGKESPVAVVVLDNCGVPASVKARLAERLKDRGITKDRLIVAATHTHNAPTLTGYAPIVWAGRTTPEQDQRTSDYTDFVVGKMESVVLQALKFRRPMSLEWAQGRVTFGGNRRILRNGKWAGFGFQRNGPVDHSLPVLAARDASGKVRAVWANYACHCTTVGSRNHVGGDWAGFANQGIEETFRSAVALMTIGCGADVGPQPSGGLQDADRHGHSIALEVQRLLNGKTTSLSGAPLVSSRTIELPLTDPKPRQYWETKLKGGGFDGQLAKVMLKKIDSVGSIPATVSYPISSWIFGRKLAMIFLAGEVVVDYSVRLNRELDWSRLWISAWANDMPGYIPSRRILAEGGYEAEFSQVYYAKPGPYRSEVEDVLVGAVTEMLGDGFAASQDQDPAPFHRIPSSEPATFQRIADWVKEPKEKSEEAVLSKIRDRVRFAQPGFKKVVKNDGEKTEWNNFSGDFAERIFIRQQVKGVELSWTASVERKGEDPLVLCFTGGIGWETEPKTDGFALLINDQQEVRFDVTREPSSWVSSDKSVELVYLPTWTSNVDSGGFFFVTVLRSVPEEKSIATISVRSLGEGSKRWFAVDSEQKPANRLERLRKALR